MKTLLALLAIFALAILTGCASAPQVKVDVDKAYASYIGQTRTYSPMTLKTLPLSKITIEGEIELTMSSPLNPLSIRSTDPNTAQTMIAAGERAVKALALGFFGYKAIDSLSASRDPVIVEQPAPLIVQPTVIGGP
jgi:hypothetical protein